MRHPLQKSLGYFMLFLKNQVEKKTVMWLQIIISIKAHNFWKGGRKNEY